MKNAPDMELKRELSKRIRTIRTDTNLSQARFADSINVSRVHLNRMESPDVEMMPSQPVLKRICKVYRVNYEWLMTGNGSVYLSPEIEMPLELPSTEDCIGINMPMVENTLSYMNLKASILLKRGRMHSRDYFRYFQLFSSLINLFFRLMQDLKEQLEKKEVIPDSFYDEYSVQFTKILENEKKNF